MMDQRRQQLIEQYEDAALSLLMDEYANEEGERLLKEFEEAKKNGDLLEMPAELDAKCRKLIDQTFAKMERKERLKRIGKSVAKVAVLTLILLGTLSTMVMSVEAFRVPVLNFLLSPNGKYQSVLFDGEIDKDSSYSSGVVFNLESNIPLGYEIVQRDFLPDNSAMICYMNAQGDILSLGIMPASGEINIDAEDTQYIELEIEGHNTLFLDKDGYYLLWWDVEQEIMYTLFANAIDEAMFMKIAYSIIE